MGTWEHENMGTWEHGNMGTWEHGNMGTWEHGNMGTWEHGNMGTWEHGNMGTWEHGNMGTWEHGNMRKNEREHGNKDPQHSYPRRGALKCRKPEPQTNVFYISRELSKVQSVLSHCNTRLGLLHLLDDDIDFTCAKQIQQPFPILHFNNIQQVSMVYRLHDKPLGTLVEREKNS